MGWKTWTIAILASPLTVSFLFGYCGYSTVAKVIYRSEAVLMTPLLSAAFASWLGYRLGLYMIANTKPRPVDPCMDIVQPSITVQVPLLLGMFGGAIGLIIDLILLAKWSFAFLH